MAGEDGITLITHYWSTMLTSRTCAKAVWQTESLLPFLYCTQTIQQQRPYTKTSRGTTTIYSSSRPSKPLPVIRKFRRKVSEAAEAIRRLDEREAARVRGHRRVEGPWAVGGSTSAADALEQAGLPGKQQRGVREAARETHEREVERRRLDAGAGGAARGRGAQEATGETQRRHLDVNGEGAGRGLGEQEATGETERRHTDLDAGGAERGAGQGRKQEKADERDGVKRESTRTFVNNVPFENVRDGMTKREASSRFIDHVPFENVKEEPVPKVGFDLEGSTITPTERKAFEKLFGIRKVTKSKKDDALDAILDAAVFNVEKPERPPPEFPLALRSMAKKAREREKQERATQVDREAEAKATAIKQDLDYVTAMMDKAPTDARLWGVLEKVVLNRLIATGIDGAPTTPDQTAKHAAALAAWQKTKSNWPPANFTGAPADDELTVFTANLPAHCIHFMRTLALSFPGSSMALTLLPHLKNLGPASFALAASTGFYNAHLRALYTAHGPHSLHSMISTLREMDARVYDFDDETSAVLEEVMKDSRRCRRGYMGEAVGLVWRGAAVTRGVKGLLGWREVVESRREEVALRRAREEEAVTEAARAEGEEVGEDLDLDMRWGAVGSG